ncbi:hypothetical protein O181_017972 [Austropuccinia psidii MF-1]|uniref:Reverse transcriptase domain-containing protein n=1 Tax=Austropuccinia psidii MF-1 TaxID=1389203 RepID=A0A9Q3GT26_9BASI|nr:hypothetical protein [Austropuccinia psidii MF-1]
MPFGLTNAPASFQNLFNDIFADFLDIFVVVYLDDIMVFSISEEEHFEHVTSVLQRLRDNDLFSKSSKCVFPASSVKYLGYFVSRDGLKIDFSKVFQKNSALTSLLKKDSPFIFNEEALSKFQILKEAFTTFPMLSHFNPSLPAIVETDASDYSLGAVLSQVNDSGKHPISSDSHKPLPAELNYEVHEKESLGIVWALKRWKAFLLSLSNSFEILTDNYSLQYFMSSKVLTCCKAHWEEFPSEFHFSITYCPGRLATLPDALSHWDNVWTDREGKSDSRIVSLNSPFFTIYGRNPSFDSIQISQDTPAGKVSTKLQSVQQVVKEELESEIKCFKKYSNRDRAILPHFQPGDKLWLASKNIKTKTHTKKLSERWLGPFEFLEKIGSHAYHLKLPQQWKSVHPVFHVSLLEPVNKSAIPNRHQFPPPPVIVEEQEKWEVAQVQDSNLKRGILWYLVEWKGLNEDPERTTWEPASKLTSSPDLIKDFHTLYPDKPGPNTSRV